MSNKVLNALIKFARTQRSDNGLHLIATDLLWSAWKEPKPLFHNEQERDQARQLLEESLSNMDMTFYEIQAHLNSDKAEEGLCFRSGLQFLFDEFRTDSSGVYDKTFAPFLDSESIKECEESIQAYQDFPDETADIQKPMTKEQKAHIPSDHSWWFSNTSS
uniref:DUF4240 domain-containing protein n=1 Tax=Rhabditophanes sp. KR3021 TaxID=114890 RepID=A0AC35TS40_9BILA